MPLSYRAPGYHIHSFIVCGVYFDIYVGKLLPRDARTAGLFPSSHRIVSLAAPNKLGTLRRAATYATRAEAKGALRE
jgi:hypothetical protein